MQPADKEQLARYLGKLAVNNPEQLPAAVLELMVRSLMVTVGTIIEDRIARVLGDWEGVLNARVNVNDKGGHHNGGVLPE